MQIKAVGVFLSAGDVAPIYVEHALRLGTLIGDRGLVLVWGGSDTGLMKTVSDAARAAGARLVGITTEHLKGVLKPGVDEAVVAPDLPERKALLLERSDALVLLPGGIGSIDEFTEILERKKHGHHEKPMLVLNIDGFYDGLELQLQRMEREGFLPRPLTELIRFTVSPEHAMEILDGG